MSVYGPVATGAEWAAAELGGTSLARITFWLKLEEALAFGAVVLALDRMLRYDPALRLRAHLLWSVNPVLLWEIVAGGHIDGLAAAFGLLGVAALRTRAVPDAGPASRTAQLSLGGALLACLLIGVAKVVWCGLGRRGVHNAHRAGTRADGRYPFSISGGGISSAGTLSGTYETLSGFADTVFVVTGASGSFADLGDGLSGAITGVPGQTLTSIPRKWEP